MKVKLIQKLRRCFARIAKYRREGYVESMRQEKRNAEAIKRQLAILEGKAQ